MANSNNSIVTGKFSGTLGKEIVFRDWDGKTVVAKAPKKRKGDPTPEQVVIQERFLLASKYARGIVKNPDQGMAEAYAANLRPRQNVYSRAVEDFMNLPEVKNINTRNYTGVSGGKIVVRAVDDFRVVSVWVEIYAANGTLLEAGRAVQDLNGLDWTFSTTMANSPLAGSKIKAIATDVPGNEGILEVSL
jgi:hypothetical protein